MREEEEVRGEEATELVFGKDPLLCRYDTVVMQMHFLKCLEIGE